MKLINKTLNNYSHVDFTNGKTKTYFLASGQSADIPDTIAKTWLKIAGVEKYADPEDLEKLKKENEALKEKVKAQASKNSKSKK